MQACLGRLHVGMLATSSRSRNLQSWPLCAKISHSLTKKNPSFQNWPKKWSLVHGPKVEGNPRIISMSWIQWSRRFVDPSDGHHSMALWSPPPTGFQGHILNPYLGHRMEIMHPHRILVGHEGVFRHVPCGNVSHTLMVKEFAKMSPMYKNFAFPYWEKP